jgi:hypothetical protein
MNEVALDALPASARATQMPRAVMVEPLTVTALAMDGVEVAAKHGRVGHVKARVIGRPWRADQGAEVAVPGETKGWWAVRVRSEFGAETVMRFDPVARTVDGLLRVSA